MQVQLIRSWRAWRVGHVFTSMPDGMANVLIRRGIGADVATIECPKAEDNSRAGARTGNTNRSKKAVRNLDH